MAGQCSRIFALGPISPALFQESLLHFEQRCPVKIAENDARLRAPLLSHYGMGFILMENISHLHKALPHYCTESKELARRGMERRILQITRQDYPTLGREHK